MKKLLIAFASLSLFSLSACDGGNTGADAGDNHSHMGEGGMCTPAETTLDNGDGSLTVAFTSSPAMIMTSESFDLTVTITANTGDLPEDLAMDIDAEMPAHGHGMNVAPTVTEGDPGVFAVEGMNLHMAGEWKMHIDVLADGGTERLTYTINCEG